MFQMEETDPFMVRIAGSCWSSYHSR